MYRRYSWFRKGRILVIFLFIILVMLASDWFDGGEIDLSMVKEGTVFALVLVALVEIFKYLEIRNRVELKEINRLNKEKAKN